MQKKLLKKQLHQKPLQKQKQQKKRLRNRFVDAKKIHEVNLVYFFIPNRV